MANHKSALKRQRQSESRQIRNKINKTKVKNMVRAVREAVDEKSLELAQTTLKDAIPAIHKAASKGTIHKRNASRKVSRLTKRVNALARSAQPAV